MEPAAPFWSWGPKALRAEGPAHSHPASQVAGAGSALTHLTFPDSCQSAELQSGSVTLEARWFVRAELTLSQRRHEKVHTPPPPRPAPPRPGSDPSKGDHTGMSPRLDLHLPHTHQSMTSQPPQTRPFLRLPLCAAGQTRDRWALEPGAPTPLLYVLGQLASPL